MVMVTAEARVMAAVMAAANATAMAATNSVVAAMAIACDDCIEGNCVGDAAAGVVTAASRMAVKAVAR